MNVAVEDIVVQLPIAVAANVCDVNVAVLGRVLDDASACEAQSGSDAQAGGGGGGAANASAFEPIDLSTVIDLSFLDNDPTTTGARCPSSDGEGRADRASNGCPRGPRSLGRGTLCGTSRGPASACCGRGVVRCDGVQR